MNDETILSLMHVGKTFSVGEETITVLSDVTIDVRKGTNLVITGESGSGKSTLLNIIGGLDSPSSGSVLSAGFRVHELDENALTEYRSICIGFIFQFHFLLKDFTALENVYLPAYMKGISRKEAKEKSLGLLSEVGLYERRNHFPSQLSGGERQRVAVARSLVNDPPIILADEPTGNLDERNSRVVEDILFSLVASHGVTLVLVTHDQALAAKGQRRMHLEHGVLEER